MPRSMRRRALGAAAVLMLVATASSPLSAQSEGTDIRYVEISSLKVRENDGKLVIEVKASAPKLPVGCKVEFLLTWRYQTIERYVVTVPANQRFDEEFKVDSYTPSPEKYVFRTQLIEPKDQPRAVRKAMEDDPETFPPGAVPWTEFQTEHEFTLGTEAEIRAERERIQTWFKEHYTNLAKLDGMVADAVKAVQAKTDYVDGKGEFQEKKWRKMMDDEVLAELKKLQDTIREGLKGQNAELLSYRRTLADLRELVNSVAFRVTDKSIELYKELGVDVSEADEKHEGVETTVRGYKRQPPPAKHLGKLVDSIKTQLGIGKAPEEEKEGDTP